MGKDAVIPEGEFTSPSAPSSAQPTFFPRGTSLPGFPPRTRAEAAPGPSPATALGLAQGLCPPAFFRPPGPVPVPAPLPVPRRPPGPVPVPARPPAPVPVAEPPPGRLPRAAPMVTTEEAKACRAALSASSHRSVASQRPHAPEPQQQSPAAQSPPRHDSSRPFFTSTPARADLDAAVAKRRAAATAVPQSSRQAD